MRQPLQILFLILVTDLPPSIALGFEPGEALTMKRAPRPKTQPIVLLSMWGGIVAHGMILTCCIFSTYIVALWAYAGAFLSDDITSDTRSKCAIWDTDGSWGPTLDKDCGMWINGNATNGGTWQSHGNSDCNICIEESIRRARTCAFIALVWAEGLRAYVSRSFENPFWVQTFSNPSMNYAVGMAQVTLVIALFLPGLSDTVLGLYVYEIHWFGWFFAALGALACLFFCELFKCWAKQFVEVGELANYTEGDEPEVMIDTTVHTELDLPTKGRVCEGSVIGRSCC
jgi:magnesium-transporting ATPase (P-type)